MIPRYLQIHQYHNDVTIQRNIGALQRLAYKAATSAKCEQNIRLIEKEQFLKI